MPGTVAMWSFSCVSSADAEAAGGLGPATAGPVPDATGLSPETPGTGQTGSINYTNR